MNSSSSSPSHYIGIGASAGGLEAINAFFETMPSDSGCAFIVIQHLSPDHKSLMVELLSKRTVMPVSRAEEGMVVEANNVYLIPPNYDLRIFHGKLLLTEQNRHGGINLPIDNFFNSLAEDQGEKAVAIILSGTGSDGTRGIKAIKEKVGMVMVQSEESAAFDGMPRSAMATGLVDYVLDPADMPQQLISYIQHPYAKKTENSEELLSDEDGVHRIFAMLREETGVDFTYYKPSTMIRRIERRMSVNQTLSLRDYVMFLEKYHGEVEALYRDLLIGVTNFFRDPKAFKLLEEKWLPELIENNSEKIIRIWISGCSTGEEAYTLAILCHDALAKSGKNQQVKIFATDVDKDAIATAGAGVYPESISADVPPEFLTKYFNRRESDFIIARHIREMVVFAQHNVLKDPPFTNIELVCCRNLLIYFQPVLQQRVMELFNFSLNPGGVLFLGASESVGDMTDYFETLHQKWKLYRSRGKKNRSELSGPALTFDAADKHMSLTRSMTSRGGRPKYVEDERIIDRLLQKISGSYIPFTMVINHRMELLHMIGDASKYLQFPSGKMITDVSKLTRKELGIPLSTGVQKALKSGEDIDYKNVQLCDLDGSSLVVDMHILMLPTLKTQDPLLGIIIEERRNKSAEPTVDQNNRYDIGKETEQRINDLEQELQFTRENLQATVEELETSNEELQATNEELLASNEELQSTNEELQSVNEELYTVNAEHQSKIVELTEVNNDMDNLLTNIRIGTVFLDENLEIRRYTQEVTRFLRIMDHDIGRPFDHLSHSLLNVDLDDFVRRANEKHESLEHEVHDRAGNTYLLRVYPYRIAPKLFSGVLLTFVNINSSKRIHDELLASEERMKLAQEAAELGSWDWDITQDVLYWSEATESLFDLAPGKFGGSFNHYLELVYEEDRDYVEEEANKCISDPTRPFFVRHRVILDGDDIHWMQSHGKVHVDLSGKPIRMIGIITDVSESIQAEEVLTRSEYVFRTTLENLDMYALQLDDKGVVTFVNNYLVDNCEWSREQIIGKSWANSCVPESYREKAQSVLDSYLQSNSSPIKKHVSPINTKEGISHIVYWNNTPLYDEEGNTIGLSSIGQTIDE
ncbi:MAG: PAS domain-containing protein [Sedimenticola sp.]|nr:PAS domain-containing protein [Sedimenticola sp.]